MMWNISISVVSPVYRSEWKIHHDTTESDILIVSNGHQLGHEREATHYSPTESTLKSWKKVGHNIDDLSVRVIEGESKGEKLGTKTFMLQEAKQIMRQHYEVPKKNKNWKEKVKTCEQVLCEIKEEMCTMKMNKDLFSRFHNYMD